MRTFKELLDRITSVQGVPFVELARAHDIEWSPDPVRNKGLAGRIVEAAMGIDPNPIPHADLTYLGLEIKTIPLGENLKVLEMTKVNSLGFQDVVDHEWEVSNTHDKLRSVIFVPVVKYDDIPDRWYIRSPFIWMASDTARAQLKADYESVRQLLIRGDIDAVSSARPPGGQGVYMTANTAGKNSKDTTTYEVGGRRITTKRRAWMLRKEFTQRIIEENVRYRRPPDDLDREILDLVAK